MTVDLTRSFIQVFFFNCITPFITKKAWLGIFLSPMTRVSSKQYWVTCYQYNSYSKMFIITCELPCILGKYSKMVSRCLLNDFFYSRLLRVWLLSQTWESILACYLTHSLKRKETYSRLSKGGICAKVWVRACVHLCLRMFEFARVCPREHVYICNVSTNFYKIFYL